MSAFARLANSPLPLPDHRRLAPGVSARRAAPSRRRSGRQSAGRKDAAAAQPDSDGAHGPSSDDPVYLTGPQILKRFQISDMTLWRWLQNPELGFPRPVVINRRRLFLLASVLEFERSRAG